MLKFSMIIQIYFKWEKENGLFLHLDKSIATLPRSLEKKNRHRKSLKYSTKLTKILCKYLIIDS